MKKILDHLPIISVCLIYFGFCNLYFFYIEFKIDIYNYISNTEILLSFLPTIVLSVSFAYFYAYQLVMDKAIQKKSIEELTEVKSEVVEEVYSKKKTLIKLFTSIPILAALYLILQLLIEKFLLNFFGYKDYQLQNFKLISALLFCLFIYSFGNLRDNPNKVKENFYIISFTLVLYIGIQISVYRKLDAIKIKNGIQSKVISFKYMNTNIKSSKNFLYVGQTQSNLFMYNRKAKTTIIYKIENIDVLEIK